jgi:hypothetical protein
LELKYNRFPSGLNFGSRSLYVPEIDRVCGADQPAFVSRDTTIR